MGCFDDALTYNSDAGVYVYKKNSDGTWLRQQIAPDAGSLYEIKYTAPKLTVSFKPAGYAKLAELMNSALINGLTWNLFLCNSQWEDPW